MLLKGLDTDDSLYTAVFYELSKTFLTFKFHHTRSGRNHTIYWYVYPIPNIQIIHNFRSQIWDAIDSKFRTHENDSFNLLLSYSAKNPDVIKEIMEFDLTFLIKIIEKYLISTSFEHCLYVQDLIRWLKRNDIIHSSFTSLSDKFTNNIYETFLIIDWDRFRDKEMYEFDDYHEYTKLKEGEIRTSFVFKTVPEVKEFYNVFVFLKKIAKNEWNYNTTLDHVIDVNCTNNFKLGCQILKLVIENGNEINYVPQIVFHNHLTTHEKSECIWKLVQTESFNRKTQWELSFFNYLNDSLINKEHPNAIIESICNTDEAIIIHLDKLVRYLEVSPTLFQDILKVIISINDEGKIQLQIWMDSFSAHFEKLGDDIETIEKAYLQQNLIHNTFDYKGKGFLKILEKDPAFLLKFINSYYFQVGKSRSDNHRDMSFIWEVADIEKQLHIVFDLISQNEPSFGFREHFCNCFFRSMKDGIKERADQFLMDYVSDNHKDQKKMNIVTNLVRYSRTDKFDCILLHYISLNQNPETFSKIGWIENAGMYPGGAIIGDIKAAKWKNILSIVEKSDVGVKLIPIKKYINDVIESCIRSGDWERRNQFLQND